MLQIKKNDLPIGLTISVLLSLFVNFSMLMRNYGFRFPAPKGVPVSDVVKVDEFFLYFPLIWFFLFAFLLFVTDSGLYRIGDRLFGKREYKTILFANGITLFTGTMLFVFHPLILNVCMNLALHTPFPELRELFRIHPNPQEMMMHDPRINFGVFPSGRVPPIFLHPQITEHIFVLVTILLCALLIRLLHGKQQMQLEYEQLKTEKWQTSYNALMGQINPHFFFNSLSGLNALIRNGEKEQTLTYLDELSNVFRYILQSNQKEMVTLAEELQFVKAYAYLLGVRYEGKLFFSIQAEPSLLLWYLPTLSVLPLVENAVKHNLISRQSPLYIDIYTNADNQLVVSNRVQPKAETETSSGIGLKNLWGRYRMLTGKDIRITNWNHCFQVVLPLSYKPQNDESNYHRR